MDSLPQPAVLTVIEGKCTRNWEPRHIKGRVEGRQYPHGVPQEVKNRQRGAEHRRDELRSALLTRVTAHHAKVTAAAAGRPRALSTSQLESRQTLADQRRQEMSRRRVRKVAEHHQRVEHVVESRHQSYALRRPSEKLRQAAERREQRLTAQREALKQHTDRINKAREVRTKRAEKTKTKSQRVVTSFKLDSEAIEDASFEQLQRKLASRQTVARASDLLELLSKNFEKVMAEEKQMTDEDTPILGPQGTPNRSPALRSSSSKGEHGAAASASSQPPSPALSAGSILGATRPGKVPLNPRLFLSAFICVGGMTEGAGGASGGTVGALESSLQEHSVSLIGSLNALLEGLSEDAALGQQKTKDLMRGFARDWESYVASFEAWKRKDKGQLLQHYIDIYSEVERGRCDIISETALKGSRRPEEHSELMGSINDSLIGIRNRIEKLAGQEGAEALGRRLKEVYSEKGLTPQLVSQQAAAAAAASAAASSPPSAGGSAQQHASAVLSPATSDFDLDAPGPASSSLADRAASGSAAPRPIFALGTPPSAPARASVPPSPGASLSPQSRERLQTAVLKAKLAHDAIFQVESLKEDADAGVDEDGEEASPRKITVQRIKAAAERAFWDMAGEELRRSPPCVDRLEGAIDTLKSHLQEIAPKKMQAEVRADFEDRLDWAVLRKAFNAQTVSGLITYFMGKVLLLEAPVENAATKEQEAELLAYVAQHAGDDQLHLTAVRSLQVLNKKLENLAKSIHSARKTLIAPLLAQDAEALVRQLYKGEVDAGLHNFETTKAWLRSSVRRMLPVAADSEPKPIYAAAGVLSVSDVMEKTNKLYTVVPALAILDLALFPGETAVQTAGSAMPESLRLHRDVLRRVADRVQLLTLAAAMTGLAGQITANAAVMAPVATEVVEMLQTPGMRLPAIVDQVAHIVDRESKTLIPAAKRDLLVSMLGKVANPDEKLYATYLSRLGAILIQAVVAGPKAALQNLSATPFAHLSAKVGEAVNMLHKLTSLNVQWTRPFYDPLLEAIVADLRNEQQQV